MGKRYNLGSEGKDRLLLLVSFGLKAVFAHRSAAALLVFPPGPAGTPKLPLALPGRHPGTRGTPSGLRGGQWVQREGGHAQREWDLEEECGAIPLSLPWLSKFPATQRGLGPACNSHVAATPTSSQHAAGRH